MNSGWYSPLQGNTYSLSPLTDDQQIFSIFIWVRIPLNISSRRGSKCQMTAGKPGTLQRRQLLSVKQRSGSCQWQWAQRPQRCEVQEQWWDVMTWKHSLILPCPTEMRWLQKSLKLLQKRFLDNAPIAVCPALAENFLHQYSLLQTNYSDLDWGCTLIVPNPLRPSGEGCSSSTRLEGVWSFSCSRKSCFNCSVKQFLTPTVHSSVENPVHTEAGSARIQIWKTSISCGFSYMQH